MKKFGRAGICLIILGFLMIGCMVSALAEDLDAGAIEQEAAAAETAAAVAAESQAKEKTEAKETDGTGTGINEEQPEKITLDGGKVVQAKLHFITTPGKMNSILVECNGHFGMIDSGEDTDYPDGSDSRYPLRSGITVNAELGMDQDVIEYLYSVGVTTANFDFYIGTHAHSDHIGSADEIIREFHPKRVYLRKYDDSLITSNNLWDSQYVYDRAVAAAEEAGSVLIQEFDTEAPVTPTDGSSTGNPVFTLGDAMTVSIVNYDVDEDTPWDDANRWSLGVVLSACGYRAYLAGDIDDFDGREKLLADEIGDVDLMALGHHGVNGSNSNYYVTTLDPEIIVNCGSWWSIGTASFSGVSGGCSVMDTLNQMIDRGTRVYAENTYNCFLDALVFDFADGLSSNAADIIVPCESKAGTFCFKDGIRYDYSGMLSGVCGLTEIRSWFDESSTAVTNAFIQDDAGNLYYADKLGVLFSGFRQIDGKWYYFDPDTCILQTDSMQTGWQKLNGAWYYLDPATGTVLSGWQKINGKWYYLDPETAVMQTGWQKIDGKWYYLDSETGAMQTGWQKIDGKWYYLNSYLRTGWQKIDGKWYYLDPETGAMQTGWQKIDGKWYYLNSYLRTGWQKIDGKWYYLNTYMRTGWQKIDGSWYYLSSELKTGWQRIDGKWYYLNSALQTGWQEIDGKRYYLNSAMQTGWQKIDGSWYYLNNAMVTGWQTISGTTYYFDETGAMQTGWQTIDDERYYFDEKGAMATGWWTIDGVVYKFDETGVLLGETGPELD